MFFGSITPSLQGLGDQSVILIFQILALSHLGFLILQVVSGMSGRPDHALSGLGVSLYGCLVHSVVLTYFIGTGRSIKDAVEAGELHPEFYTRARLWYRSRGFPATIAAICILILAAVLGAAVDAQRSPVASWGWTHPVAGWLALFLNAAIFPVQKEQILRNSGLMDEANRILKDPNRRLEAPSTPLVAARKKMSATAWLGRLLIYVGAGAWLPFITLRYVVGGPLEKLSPWPFLAVYLVSILAGVGVSRSLSGRSPGRG